MMEMKKYGEAVEVVEWKTLKQKNYPEIPDKSTWKIDPEGAYFH